MPNARKKEKEKEKKKVSSGSLESASESSGISQSIYLTLTFNFCLWNGTDYNHQRRLWWMGISWIKVWRKSSINYEEIYKC